MKNKLWTLTLTLIILTLALVGCQGESVPEPETGILNQSYAEDALPIDTQLIVGTIKLEETDLAVDAEMAEELLPLWKMYKSLIESDIAAQEEVTALINQIQNAMKTEQIEAIAAMELSREDMSSLNQGMNQSPDSAKEGANSFGGGQGGGMPGGGMSGAGGGAGRSDMSPDEIATAQAMREEMGGGMRNMFNAKLVEELITMLEAKIQ